MGADQRRSDRLLITIPLQIQGKDAQGAAFKAEASTVSINRHGACVRVARPLETGQLLRVVNQVTRQQADFHVVGPVSKAAAETPQWGIECTNAQVNIWGIYFPPIPPGEVPEATALVECQKCHTVAVLRLTIVESDVLNTAGIFSKQCDTCQQQTPWSYVEKQAEPGTPPDIASLPIGPDGKTVERRRYRRVAMQLPVLVRDYMGRSEVARSDNIGNGGFCFVSEKSYRLGQGLIVTCPYNAASPSAELRAHVAHLRPLAGTDRKIYGVRYDEPAK